MKNLILIYALLLIVSPLLSHSIKFVAMDRYYEEVVPIDSILVHDMNTGEEKLYQTDSLFFETVSSVEELTNENSLHLYPNPVEDILNINTNSSEIIISDISGKVHYKSSTVISGNVSLNVAGLLQGVYAIRTGNKSQTFIKNTPSNGQDVRLLSSSNSQSSLVKEVEVQSQFDNRFTIYSDGFKPKNYYTKALTKDTVVELDMSTITKKKKKKHIRVTLFIKNYISDYSIKVHQDPEIKYTRSNDITEILIDTLVIRNGKVNLVKYYKNEDEYNFDKHKIQFDIDTLNQTISNFRLTKESNVRTGNIYGFHDESQFLVFNFEKSVTYSLSSENIIFEFYKELNAMISSENQIYSNYGCLGHYTNWNFQSCDVNNSYIKIEFID